VTGDGFSKSGQKIKGYFWPSLQIAVSATLNVTAHVKKNSNWYEQSVATPHDADSRCTGNIFIERSNNGAISSPVDFLQVLCIPFLIWVYYKRPKQRFFYSVK
jgi:hypothetical protein